MKRAYQLRSPMIQRIERDRRASGAGYVVALCVGFGALVATIAWVTG